MVTPIIAQQNFARFSFAVLPASTFFYGCYFFSYLSVIREATLLISFILCFYMIKNWPFILLLLGIVGCSAPSSREEAVLINDLVKATAIIAEKNDTHFDKIRTYYQRDSSDLEIRKLHQQFSAIQHHKTIFLKALQEGKDSIEAHAKEFVSKSMEHLNENEQRTLQRVLQNSRLSEPALLNDFVSFSILHYELALEAEIFVQEIYKVVLKNPNRKKTTFNWEYFW
jgi:hypothetical protein